MKNTVSTKIVGLCIIFLSGLFAHNAQAATLTVTKIADTADGVCDADCSLREAIIAAAANDTIQFDPMVFAVPRTISLTISEFAITKNLTINGPGVDLLIIDGINNKRIFNIQVNNTLTVNNLTMLNGRSSAGNGGCVSTSGVFNFVAGVMANCLANNGGAVYSDSSGTVNIVNSTVRDNSATVQGGAFFIDGQLLLTNSSVYGNSADNAGGGIFLEVNRSASITNSVLATNTAPAGGGMYSLGTTTFTSSTVNGNTAQSGAGVYNDSIANFYESTVSGNRATSNKGGGIYNAAGRITHLLNATITNNQADSFAGAGIWNENFNGNGNNFISLRTRNSIIAGNISGNGNPVDYVGDIVDLGNNLINNANPGLAPLGNYGGPTPTHALLPNSPAINAGSDCILTANTCGISHIAYSNDQRGAGAPRKIGPSVDIGAFERNISTNPSSLQNGVNGLPYSQTLTVTRSSSLAEILQTIENILPEKISALDPFTYSVITLPGQSLPPGLSLSSNGTLSGTPTQVGTFTFTVKAADSDGMAGVGQYSITVFATNTTPTISGATISRQSGSSVSNSQIATVNDAETGPSSVNVTIASANPSNGVTVSNVVNTNGNVTADVIAGCSATNATFTLTASDGSLTANSTLTVNAMANTAPTLQYPAPAPINSGSSLNVTPTAAGDNGQVTYSILSVSPALTNLPSVDANGVVSITNANAIGSHVITVRSTDNCGLTTDASFTVTVLNTRIVTKTDDTNDGVCDTDCSLREAIAVANNGDIIQFASPLFDSPQTILLADGLNSLVINKNVVISGRGANLLNINRPSGSLFFRIFTINASNVVISGMTVSGGDTLDGGGIKIDAGSVILRGMVVEGNSAHADGGGIYVNSGVSLNLDSSTIRNNTITTSGNNDGNGGGILAQSNSQVTIANSQIYGNVIEDRRTSNFAPFCGGGGVDSYADLTVLNSLIIQNSATAFQNFGNQRCTGGGLNFRNTGTLRMKNSVIADNTSGVDQGGIFVSDGAQDLAGYASASGGNLVRIRESDVGFVPSDLPNGTAPMLALGNNGGTATTYAPVAGSPLIDHGETCVAATNGCGFTHPAITRDIRGAARPFDGDNNGSSIIDIGAVELGSSPSANAPQVDVIQRNGYDMVAPGANVRFNVVFSQNVTGVDASDFLLTTTGSISGASVTNIFGSGSSYQVNVNVGSGTGTVRLDVSDNDSIKNASNVPLGGTGVGNGSFTVGEFYTVTTDEIDVTSPVDTLQIYNFNGQYGTPPPENEGPARAIDNTTSKYLNFYTYGSGFIVTPQRGATVLSAIRFYTANDSPERDPAEFVLEGSNNGGAIWNAIALYYPLSLPLERNPAGLPLTTPGLYSQTVQLPAGLPPFWSYRVWFGQIRGNGNSMQIGEVELLGRPTGPTAAGVSVSGRLISPRGRGVTNAVVFMTDSTGHSRRTRSSGQGDFQFDDVEAGRTYTLTVASKLFRFSPRIVSVVDPISGLDLMAEGND